MRVNDIRDTIIVGIIPYDKTIYLLVLEHVSTGAEFQNHLIEWRGRSERHIVVVLLYLKHIGAKDMP